VHPGGTDSRAHRAPHAGHRAWVEPSFGYNMARLAWQALHDWEGVACVRRRALLVFVLMSWVAALPHVVKGREARFASSTGANASSGADHVAGLDAPATTSLVNTVHLPFVAAALVPGPAPTNTSGPTHTAVPTWAPGPTATYPPTLTATHTRTPRWTLTLTVTVSPTAAGTATSSVIPTVTPTPTTEPVSLPLVVGHISDAHIGGAWVYSQRLPALLGSISSRAQVVVDTGDCTEHGTVEETVEYMRVLTKAVSVPWRATPGNHDTPWIFEQYIGPLEWSWDVGSYRLIGINTEAINYTALDQALTYDKPCIVFGHFPLDWCTPVDQDKLRQRFQLYQVPVYIAGHTHLDSVRVDAQSGTVLLTGKPAGLGHYRLITLDGHSVQGITFESSN
jgi:predicted phosphodiesterase